MIIENNEDLVEKVKPTYKLKCDSLSLTITTHGMLVDATLYGRSHYNMTIHKIDEVDSGYPQIGCIPYRLKVDKIISDNYLENKEALKNREISWNEVAFLDKQTPLFYNAYTEDAITRFVPPITSDFSKNKEYYVTGVQRQGPFKKLERGRKITDEGETEMEEMIEKVYTFGGENFRGMMLTFETGFMIRITPSGMETQLRDFKYVVNNSDLDNKEEVISKIENIATTYREGFSLGGKTYANTILRSMLYDLIDSLGVRDLYEYDGSCNSFWNLKTKGKTSKLGNETMLAEIGHRVWGKTKRKRKRKRKSKRKSKRKTQKSKS